MNLHFRNALLFSSFGLCGLASFAAGQRVETAQHRLADTCVGANPASAVMIHAPKSSGAESLTLCDGHALAGAAQIGDAQPSVARVWRLRPGRHARSRQRLQRGEGRHARVYRGNVGTLWPYRIALHNRTPSAFFPDARVFSVPERPDFLVTGDFNADGHWDIVTAQRGSNALYFLRGDGHGGFRAAKRVPIAGAITALIAGEMDRPDGLADLLVATTSGTGARVLVLESPEGAVNAQPEIFNLPQPATALALGRFDGGGMHDLAIAAGNELIVVHGRDRKLSLGALQQAGVPAARVTPQRLPFSIAALAAGDFTGTGPGLAALGSDGRVHILEHALSPTALGVRAAPESDGMPTMQLSKPGRDGKPVTVTGVMTPGTAMKLAALRQAGKTGPAGWTQRSVVDLPSGFSQSSPQLIPGRLSGSEQDDIIAVDAGNSQIHVLSTIASRGVLARGRSVTSPVRSSRSVTPTPASMKLLASLDAQSAPAAVLPMRLNQHGLNGLVTLHTGQSEPTVTPQDSPSDNIFTVTNTQDITSVGQMTDPPGSLRAAIDAANSTCGSGGTCNIVFDIPTSDPGYSSSTGAFLIQPLSSAPPGADSQFALPPINATVTIDGYTQPGASPNTLANGDNAKILIRIDGSLATTPGGSGLVPFDSVGTVIRGVAFTGWTNGEVSNGTESGAEGIEANGVADFIEGNFFGTDTTGKTAVSNRIGVFADNGPLFGSEPGNVIGGTTFQARNLLSGNQVGGILFLSDAYLSALEGNFIGTDVTGAAPLGNLDDGAGLNGPTVTVGGTLPGAANVISGNGTNVDINDLTNGYMAMNSTVQGNLIGTDVTGTTIVAAGSGTGVSILNNPQYMTIGGTTPSARNIISGNYYGVYVFDNSFYNTVQGNWIGVDISGAHALGNVNQGFISGATTSSMTPAGTTALGGAVAGAGNIISGNGADGVSIAGTSNGPDYSTPSSAMTSRAIL